MATNLQYAGEYKLKELLVHCSSGNVLNLTKATQSIDIYEDMFSTSLSGSITILDVDNIAENGPVIGQEFMTLRITTPTLDNLEIDIMFTIYKVSVRESLSQDTQMLSLSFTSPELMKNKQVRVSKSYTDSIHNIIENVLRDTRYIGTDRDIYIERTLGTRKVVCPNLHPFDFISNLINEATTEKDSAPHFFFYENLKGIQVKSLGAIFSEDAVGNFNTGDISKSSKDVGVTIDPEKDFNRALEFQINSNNDMLLNTMAGLMGSSTTQYNIYNKTFNTLEYDYFEDFERFPRIDANPVFNDMGENSVGSRTFLHPTNTNGTFDSSHNGTAFTYQYAQPKIAESIPFRRAKLMELNNGVNITMKINGNTTIAAGQIINLTVPVSGRVHDKENDEYYSGRYLITKLRHSFYQPDKKHEIILTASKDSLPKEHLSSRVGKPNTRIGTTTTLNY